MSMRTNGEPFKTSFARTELLELVNVRLAQRRAKYEEDLARHRRKVKPQLARQAKALRKLADQIEAGKVEPVHRYGALDDLPKVDKFDGYDQRARLRDLEALRDAVAASSQDRYRLTPRRFAELGLNDPTALPS